MRICESPVDLVFVMDNSGSINYRDGNNWNRMLDFVVKVIKRRIIGPSETQIGVLLFSTDIINTIYMNSYDNGEDLINAVKAIKYNGGHTNTAGALEMLRTSQFNTIHGDRPNVRNVAVIITDGEPTLRVNDTFIQAQLAKDAGIEIISIGVSNSIGIETITQISSSSQRKYVFLMDDFSDLSSILDPIFEDICEPVTDIVRDLGDIGATGRTGNIGNKGSDGIGGATGGTGNRGRSGVDGTKGISGTKGRFGNSGEMGSTGHTGETGHNGRQGQTGLSGRSGQIGLTGISGPKGSDGNTMSKNMFTLPEDLRLMRMMLLCVQTTGGISQTYGPVYWQHIISLLKKDGTYPHTAQSTAKGLDVS